MGFADKLRLMTVLMEDLKTVKELGIKGCRECCFSRGGQYFAAVNGTTISIYNTYTCENVGNLRGHNGKVRSVCSSVAVDRAACSTALLGLHWHGAEWRAESHSEVCHGYLCRCARWHGPLMTHGSSVQAWTVQSMSGGSRTSSARRRTC